MTAKQAAAILEKYNKWRRGEIDKMPDPKKIGIAINTILEYFKTKKDENIN